MEQREVFGYDIPNNGIFNEVISVNQDIAKRDDTLALADLTSYIRSGLDKTVQRFADNFKLPLDAASQQSVFCIVLEHFPSVKTRISSQACLISSSSFLASSCIEHLSTLIDGFKKIRIFHGMNHYEVNVPVEKRFQRLQQAEVGVGVLALF